MPTSCIPAPNTLTASRPGRVRRLAQRHPLVVLMLVFNVLGQAFVLVPTLTLGERAPNLELLQSIGLLAFLLLPGLVLVRLSDGPDALRALLRGVVRFRVHPLWYLLPLVAVPAAVLLVNVSLPHVAPLDARTVGAAYVQGFLPALVIQFVTTNWWEETVWTGVVQAPLQQRFGPVRGVLLTTPWFALEHVFLTLGGTLADGLALMGLLTVSLFFVRAGFGWVHRRTGSLALVGLVHAASNAAVLGMATRLYAGPADSVVALAVFGILALLLSRGRLGW